MRIAFDARAATENVTGIGRILLETALGLSKKGHEITLIYDKEPSFQLKAPSINSVSIGKGGRFLWEQGKLKSFLEKNQFDIFHEFWNFGIPLFYNKTSVLTIHDLIPKVIDNYYSWKALVKVKPLYELSLKISISKAKKIFVDSESTMKDLLKFFPTAHTKTIVCYAGVDHRIKVPTGSVGVEIPKEPYFVYFGGIDPRKNIGLLIKAFKDVRNSFNAKLVVVGKYLGDYDGIVQDLSLVNEVLFPGFLSQEALEVLISKSIGVVYPSSYEGFGFPLLEAQKSGAAVITSSNSSLIELAGDSALLIKPTEEELNKAMKQLLLDEKLRNQLISLGKKNVERFKWEETVSKVEKVYQELING